MDSHHVVPMVQGVHYGMDSHGGLEIYLFFTRPSRGRNSLEIKGWICSQLSNLLQGAHRGYELCFSFLSLNDSLCLL